MRYFCTIVLMAHCFGFAQQIPDSVFASKVKSGEYKVCYAILMQGDTVPVVDLPVFLKTEKRTFKSKREERRYTRLQRNVVKVYPLAKLAGQKFAEYSDTLLTLEKTRDRKRLMKQIEQELKKEYEADLTRLTMTQGRILIKLIDRETGETSYEVVRELRNGFTAFFWQGIARIFGHNLKAEYDPYGEDQQIENIVVLIERGVF